jgi:hypothetical protein
MFTEKQIKQLSDREISLEKASEQLELFKKGIEPVKLIRPAVPDDGIEIFDKKKIDDYVNLFNKSKSEFSFIKFVPASGAASRMFKSLFETLNELVSHPDDALSVIRKSQQINGFFEDLKNYAFYEDLDHVCKLKTTDLVSLLKSENYAEVLNLFLSGEGLGYGELPKGLLKFHKYTDESRTAFEEHFVEASMYLKDQNSTIKIHFTVSPEHLGLFNKLAEVLIKKYLKKLNAQFNIGFSVQKPSTDTLAVDMENNPLILEDQKLLFRPGGHGALLDNMQDITENIVFIGNIDNVAPDRTMALRVRYKELLAGILIERIKVIHSFLQRIETGYTEELKTKIIDFVKNYISATSASDLIAYSDKVFANYALKILNRPVRVCGMVRNVGEPGGGPFWISDKSGNISKQIVESSQANLNDPAQNVIFMQATHFNPVDLVCFISDYKGKPFRLEDFRDPDMAFIAVKSQGGASLKALELPGLWNGSMAGWLTFFVEVPIETFSPVKTIFDLRREEHIA